MIIVRWRIPQGRLQLIVVEAEDLVDGRKGREHSSFVCMYLKVLLSL